LASAAAGTHHATLPDANTLHLNWFPPRAREDPGRLQMNDCPERFRISADAFAAMPPMISKARGPWRVVGKQETENAFR